MAEHHYRDWFHFLTSNLPGRRPAEWFRFVSGALPKDAFHVIRFSGTEGLNELFSFTIELVSRNAAIDGEQLMSVEAEFVILREKGTPAVFRGFPSRLEQGGHFGEWTYYTVELRPAFWKLTKVTGNAIFLNKTAQEAAAELLTSQPFFQFGHEFRLMRRYPVQEFAMQYGESLYDYILFRMEEQGAYFYFAPDGDKVIFADTPLSHNEPVARLTYAPGSGMEFNHRDEVLHSFTLTQTPLPRQVVLRCYDWRDPKRVIVGRAEVSPHGLGDVYLAGENAESENEANRLAKIRSEELVCRSRVFTGMGTVPTLRPGVRFKLEGHYSETFNKDYLVTEITHEGAQEAFVTLGLGIPLESSPNHLFYRNSFSCIRTNVPYRPARTAPRAKIAGVLRAFVDGAQNRRPELDEFGRYKLIFPFDLSGRKGGNASCWIRMAGPQSGQDSGMAFPLLPGTEVVVSFIDGNPDRPVITGSLPNGETGAIAGMGNPNASGVRTTGGVRFTLDDTDNSQGFALATAAGKGIQAQDSAEGGTIWSSAGMIGTLAGLGTAEFATTSQTLGSGYKISQIAGGDWLDFGVSMLSGIVGGIGKAADTLSEKKGSGVVAGAAGLVGDAANSAKALTLVAGPVIRKVITKPRPGYGVTLSASKDQAESTLEIRPNWANVVAAGLSALSAGVAVLEEVGGGVAQSVGTAVETVGIWSDAANQKEAAEAELKAQQARLEEERQVLQKLWGESPNDPSLGANPYDDPAIVQRINYLTDEIAKIDSALSALENNPDSDFRNWGDYASGLDYGLNTAHKIVRSAVVAPIATALPALVAAVATIKAAARGKGKNRGGVSLCSEDSNVNIRAAEPVSLHSQGGILLDTKLGLDDAAGWGIKGLTGSQDLNPEALSDDAKKWRYTKDKTVTDKPNADYVVVHTKDLGLFAEKIRVATGEGKEASWISVSPLCTLTTDDKGEYASAKLEIKKVEGSGVITAEILGNDPKKGTIKLQRGSEAGGQIFKLAEDKCVLQNGGNVHLEMTKKQVTLKGGEEGITLEVPKGKKLTIKVGNKEYVFAEDKVTIGNELDMTGLTIKGSDISGKAPKKVTIDGNALKA